jgi:hypothetical protein
MNQLLDITLRQLYLEFDTPADRVLSNPKLAERFFKRVSDRAGVAVERETVFNRLLYLRKKGVLPRLRRK